ncbi:MAG: hypothetical protein IPN54_14275 [Bacteroidetes bacterium]|nr:hypothetical protein [Bacteroidota bacterium]MBK9048164.1 hypothetical protein [Bacteroidota bacterium]MBK9425273.1 hypothetical protein [Bacteroidota bacterium]
MVIAQITDDTPSLENLNFWEELFKYSDLILSPISSLVTILTAGCAVYLYFKNRKQVSLLFSVLRNFGTQVSLTELTLQMNKLAGLYVADGESEQIIHLLAEIEGQLSTNKSLLINADEMVRRMKPFILGRRTLTEPDKRTIVSSLREAIRMSSYQNQYENLKTLQK